MWKFLDQLYKNQTLIYKYFLYLVSIFLIVFFLPKGGQFKYECQKGKPRQYDNLYAPFDFSLKKTDAEIAKEKSRIENRQIDYYSYNDSISDQVYKAFDKNLATIFPSEEFNTNQRSTFKRVGKDILDELYKNGILKQTEDGAVKDELYLVRNNEAKLMGQQQLYHLKDVEKVIGTVLGKAGLKNYEPQFQELFFGIVKPNVFFDKSLSRKSLENELSKISYTRGNVDEGKLIIAKGEVVESENLKILNSLKDEYASELWAANNYYFFLSGYTVLVALVLIMLLFFLKKYRPEIYRNNTKITFIFFNILLMVFVTTLVVKYNEAFVFVVPLCILPLILKTFFDARTGLFVHVLTVLILGFVVPNSFEY